MSTETLTGRLREAIQARRAVAEAADKASPGPWVNTGQEGDGDCWQIHGAPTSELTMEYPDGDDAEPVFVPVLSRVAALQYEDGGGVWTREAADHIAANDPARILRDCDAHLALLDAHVGYLMCPQCSGLQAGGEADRPA